LRSFGPGSDDPALAAVLLNGQASGQHRPASRWSFDDKDAA